MTTIRAEVSRDVISLDGSASIRAAAVLMEERRIGSVGVLEEGALVGLVTESDLVSASLVREASHDTAIRVAMRSIPMVDADCSVDSCQATMRDHHTRHLLVEEGGVIVGIITMRHILRLMLEEQRWAAQHLEDYITGGGAALRGA